MWISRLEYEKLKDAANKVFDVSGYEQIISFYKNKSRLCSLEKELIDLGLLKQCTYSNKLTELALNAKNYKEKIVEVNDRNDRLIEKNQQLYKDISALQLELDLIKSVSDKKLLEAVSNIIAINEAAKSVINLINPKQ